MMRKVLMSVMIVGCVIAAANAQIVNNQAITPQGDYLRGVGYAALGLGQYNLLTAEAISINVDTEIRLTDYIRTITRLDGIERQKKRIEKQKRSAKILADIRERLENNPKLHDVQNGDALNALRQKLGSYTNSETRGASDILLPADVVHRIPFKLAQTGFTISMPRILHSEKGWPVEFQDHAFDNEKRAYDRAMSNALGQFVDVQMQAEAIQKVKLSISALEQELGRRKNTLDPKDFTDASNHLEELKKYTRMLQDTKVQEALVDLDSYSGTTIVDLVKFMNDHSLQFEVSDHPEERKAYREIYEALDNVKKYLQGDDKGTRK